MLHALIRYSKLLIIFLNIVSKPTTGDEFCVALLNDDTEGCRLD